jgi:uncharacterized protein YbbC (DUF1343 family)
MKRTILSLLLIIILAGLLTRCKTSEDIIPGAYSSFVGMHPVPIVHGMTAQQIRDSWKPGLEKFGRIRAKYLLYPDKL